MKLILKQKEKNLFGAEFEIVENNNIVGNISLQGKVGTMEVSLKGILYGKNFNLNCLSEIITGNNKRFRPYNILENNNIVGQLYQTEFKKIYFQNMNLINVFIKKKNMIYTQ